MQLGQNNMPDQNYYKQPTIPKEPAFKAKLADFVQKHKVLSLIIIAVIIFVPLGFIVMALSSSLNQTTDLVEGQTIPEDAPIPFFENRDLIEFYIGDELSTEILSTIGDIITNPDEIASAPSKNVTENDSPTYTIIAEQVPFDTPANEEYTFFHFTLKVSDGRKYSFWFRTNQDFATEYVVSTINRTDLKDRPSYIFYYVENDDLSIIPDTITAWVESLHLPNPSTQVFPLPDLEYNTYNMSND